MFQCDTLEMRRFLSVATVMGTPGSDFIEVGFVDSTTLVSRVNGVRTVLPRGTTQVDIIAQEGNDIVSVRPTVKFGTRTFLGDGNDLGIGGKGPDTVYGGTGNDTIVGDAGSDSILGQDGRDLLDGGLGKDFISGQIGEGVLANGVRTGVEFDILIRDSNKDRVDFGAEDLVFKGYFVPL